VRVKLPYSLILIGLGFLSAACGDTDGTGPSQSLIGRWDFIGFSDNNVEATTTGTMEFRSNGTVSLVGTVTYPGEPLDSVVVHGTWQQTENTILLTFSPDPATAWTPAFTGDVLLLTAVEPPPQNTIRLRRQ
jgi:hypothetical protein